ncbi:MAG TPA: hypothetical protein PKZ84_16505 [Anaerolineae bacterium]|nr:hypothetical protein [Anaerolineae bacterium]
MNQDSSRVCSNCGTALSSKIIPAAGGTPEPAELPDWLFELTEEPAAAPAASPLDEEPASAALPDWLSDILGETPGAAEETAIAEEPLAPAELPAWFSDFATEPPASAEAPPVEEELPDWLAGIVGSEPAAAQESPVEEELPDWISGSVPEKPAPIAEEALAMWGFEASPSYAPDVSAEMPEWLLATADAPAAPEPQGPTSLPAWLLATADKPSPLEEPVIQELPAWLLQGAEEVPPPSRPARESVTPPTRRPLIFEPEPVQPAASEEAEPDWLSGILVEEPEPAPVSPAPRVEAEPDWLSGILVEEPEPAPVSPAPHVEAEPDWLSGILVEEPASTPAAPTSPQATMPDWLAGIMTEEPEAAPARPAPAEEAVPDWLSGILLEEPASAPAQPTPTEEAVPDWLSGIFVEEAEPTPAQPKPAVSGEALPDWLAGVIVEEPAPAVIAPEGPFKEETPDWLSALTEEAAPPSTEKPGVPAAPVVAETPDWLAGLGVKEPERPVSGEAAPGERRAPRAAMPDWLKDVTPPSEVAVLKPTAPAFVPDETEAASAAEDVESALFGESEAPAAVFAEGAMPDWLRDLAPTESGQPPAEEETPLEDETLVRAEVPAWLQGLRPPGTGPLPPLPEAEITTPEAPGGEGRLARAEIPDWVQELRPAMTAGRTTEKALFPELTEKEGPLAGLVGVLPAGLLVDMPADFEAPPNPVIPESVIAQAQLWQALLEQPRGVKRPVAQQRIRPGEGEMATRWLVTLVLVAVTVLGLLLGDAQMSQALSKPHIENLAHAIQALESGNTVIVAVEYGPAEAGEMTPIAEALIGHLKDRGVRIVMVSTLPEGAGLAQGLLAASDEAASLSAQAVYLPGSSNGIAMFMSGAVEDAQLLVVLAGRTERLRWWVEQNNASRPNAPLPMGIGVSAAVGPLVLPYLETPAVKGWLVGFPDVVAYCEFRGIPSERALSGQLDALLLTHWAALGLLLFGLLYYMARGKKGVS